MLKKCSLHEVSLSEESMVGSTYTPIKKIIMSYKKVVVIHLGKAQSLSIRWGIS